MAFSIRLLPATIRGPDGQRLGEIRIETFTERFAVYPLAGTVNDVATGWSRELRRLIAGRTAVGLPTAPNMAWLLYRFGRKVLVHQSLIFPGWRGKLVSAGNITRVPPYRSASVDGQQISEWSTTIAAVRAFAVSSAST
jgi:hypothetical protein